jgi:hypothetical protein
VARAPARPRAPRPPSNHVSEWFGHRVYPEVRTSPQALDDQHNRRCPFLTAAKDTPTECTKADNAKGVCTISTKPSVKATRQDWLVCPTRVLGPSMLNAFVGRLFGFAARAPAFIIPGLRLSETATRADVATRLTAGERVFIYFNKTLGGELSIPGTDASPEFSFDVTVFEIVLRDGHPNLDRFGVIEVQTMDFHGSYKHAVQNLRDGLRLFPTDFPNQLQANQQWLSEHVEGPNIANVFKRTFYQMMFKFQLGQHPRCAGCVLAIPVSVWNSWGPHLGNPKLTAHGDGTDDLFAPGTTRPAHVPAWIYVFGLDADDATTPSPLVAKNIIATDAPAMGHYALSVAPTNSLASIGSEAGMLTLARSRISALWPELGATLTADPAR